MTYGRRLDEALTHAGKSRRALADVLGCTPQAIGIVINWVGEKDRKLETEAHARCAKFLKVDHYWLATGEGEMISEANHATAPVDKAQAAIKDIAPEIQAVLELLERIPPESINDAAWAASRALIGYLPRAASSPAKIEQAPAVTQENTSS